MKGPPFEFLAIVNYDGPLKLGSIYAAARESSRAKAHQQGWVVSPSSVAGLIAVNCAELAEFALVFQWFQCSISASVIQKRYHPY